MKLRPVGSKVLVKLEREEEVSPGGIVRPESAEEPDRDRGTVKALGPGKLLKDGTRAPWEIKKGDFVVFNPNAAAEADKDHVLVDADDIEAVLS